MVRFHHGALNKDLREMIKTNDGVKIFIIFLLLILLIILLIKRPDVFLHRSWWTADKLIELENRIEQLEKDNVR